MTGRRRSPDTARLSLRFSHRMDRVGPSAIRELLILGADPKIISFGGGYPDPALFPLDDLQTIFTELLVPENVEALQYTASNGLPDLREQIARRMTADGTPTGTDDVLIIQGGQQGLDLSAKLMIDPGDMVITENPTFLGALIAFDPYQPEYAVVPIDADGMIISELEKTLEANPRAKMIYTVPDFQNPAGVTLSEPRRRRLIELANHYGLLVVEDTPYRELRYDGTPLPTLRSLDIESRVVHLGSFSKILAPGLRLGWAVADADVLERLGLLKLAADTQSSTLNMAATSAYLTRFDIDSHIARSRAVYCGRRDLMLATMAATFPAEVSYTRPDGGLFTWLNFPPGFDAATFMKEELLPNAQVAYVPGATFFPLIEETNHARLSFSGVADERLVRGITRLGELLDAKFSRGRLRPESRGPALPVSAAAAR